MLARRIFRASLGLAALLVGWVILSRSTEAEPPPRNDPPADTRQQDLIRELKARREELDRAIQAAERTSQPQPAATKPTERGGNDRPLPAKPALPTEVPAVKFDRVGSYGGGYAWNMSLGWEFETTASVEITALGIWDSDGNGLDVEVPIGLWNDAGQLLATTDLPAGTTARLVDGFRYADITPVKLPSGKRFVVAALYTPQMKDGNVSGGANISLAAPLRWIRACRTRSESLSIPTATVPTNSGDELLGNFGPGFLMASNDVSKGVRNYYRRRHFSQPPRQQIIVVPEQPDGSHRENKIITISLFALPDGRLTQIMFDSIPLGTGERAFADLAEEVRRWKEETSADKPEIRLAAMSTVRDQDLQSALNILEQSDSGRRDTRNFFKSGETPLFAKAKIKQPVRDGKFIVTDRFRDDGDFIEDRWTGLLWQKDGTVAGKKNFYQARDYAADLKLGEMKGWRVPKIEELATIFPATFTPFTNSKYNPDSCCSGPNEFASFWTSELDLRLDDYAFLYQWYAAGGANNCFASKNYAYVRCVHDPLAGKK